MDVLPAAELEQPAAVRLPETGSPRRTDSALRSATFLSSPPEQEAPTPELAYLPKTGFVAKRKGEILGEEVDLTEMIVRHLVAQGSDILIARTQAEAAAAMNEHLAKKGRPFAGPRLWLRTDRGTIWIKDAGGIRKPTGLKPRPGEHFSKHPGAVAALARHAEERVRGILGRALKKEVKVSQAFVEFLAATQPGEAAHAKDLTSFDAFVTQLGHLEVFFGKAATLADLGINTGKQFVDHWVELKKTENPKLTEEEIGATRRYAAQMITNLKTVLNWYCQEHHLEPINIRTPNVRQRGVVCLTFDQLWRLIQAARGSVFDETGKLIGRHDRSRRYECVLRFILFYFYGGTRHSNIQELMWGQDLVNGHVHPANKTMQRQGGMAEISSKRRGTSNLLGSLASLATIWHDEDEEARAQAPGLFTHVIHTPEGKSIAPRRGAKNPRNNRVWYLFKEVRELAGLKWVKPHHLKATGLSFCALAGMPPALLEIEFSTSFMTIWTDYTDLRSTFAKVLPYDPKNLTLLRLRKLSPPSAETVRAAA